MIIFTYDKTFEGLLCVVFEAYSRKLFPDILWKENEPLPLFYDQNIPVNTDEGRAKRVWKGLEKKLSKGGLSFLHLTWLSELPDVDLLLFRYIRKNIDAPHSIELNFGDPDVLEISKIWKKVNQEKHRMLQFIRFRKTADGVFFAVFEPLYNVLSLAISHFKDRFGDQRWLIYDVKRKYGYYYDLQEVTEVYFEQEFPYLTTGKPDDALLAEDEKQFQRLWQTYFHAITIRERLNPKLHRQNMPARFWKFLIEKQSGSPKI